MSRRVLHLPAALLLASVVLVTTGCGDDTVVEADDYVDGMVETSDLGAFRVTLWSEVGDVEVGVNTMWIRVAMPDPAHPDDEGKGIPGAEIDAYAFMPNAPESSQDMGVEPTITYLSDGVYRVDDMMIGQPGVWQLDFELEVGATIEDHVSFAFEVDGVDGD